MFEIYFLGTGSAAPSLSRKHSSFAIRKNGDIILFDCGESCQHQIIRANLSFNKIKVILISHLHGDHIYGLPGLLSTMFLNKRDFPITIYGPKGIKRFIQATQTPESSPNRSLNIIEFNNHNTINLLKNINIRIFSLNHSVPTFGFRLEEDDRPGIFYPEKAKELDIPPGPLYGDLQKGRQIKINGKTIDPSMVMGPCRKGLILGYVSDTVICENSLNISKNADILIHEGTYLEKDRDKAEEYLHCTFFDAARTAFDANAKKLYITHIGTRYNNQELKEELKEARKLFRNTYLAKDLLNILVNYDEHNNTIGITL